MIWAQISKLKIENYILDVDGAAADWTFIIDKTAAQNRRDCETMLKSDLLCCFHDLHFNAKSKYSLIHHLISS